MILVKVTVGQHEDIAILFTLTDLAGQAIIIGKEYMARYGIMVDPGQECLWFHPGWCDHVGGIPPKTKNVNSGVTQPPRRGGYIGSQLPQEIVRQSIIPYYLNRL